MCPTLAGTRARHLPPCWPPPASFSRPRCPGRSHAAAPHRSHSPSPSSSPPALSPSHPRTTAAADGHHHSHRPPLASPTHAEAPLLRPEAPRQAVPLRTPRGAVAVAKFDSGRRGSSPAIRELPGIPDLALALAGSAVSPRTEPPPPRVRLLCLGLSSAMAEARLRSSLSPALLRRPFGHASAPSTLAAPRSAPLAL